MKYNIKTTSDYSYFPFLRILINSILLNCNKKYLNKIYIFNTGTDESQLKYLTSLSPCIIIINTGSFTNFKGGTWGEDWQLNVKGKTKWLLETINMTEEPVLMLDSDMMVIKDLHELLIKGGDIQVCARNNRDTPYIGSYFFSINKEKSIPFLKEWIIKTNSSDAKRPLESPALCRTVLDFSNKLKFK